MLSKKHLVRIMSAETPCFKTVGLHYITFQSIKIENKVLPKEKREHNVKISVLVTNFG